MEDLQQGHGQSTKIQEPAHWVSFLKNLCETTEEFKETGTKPTLRGETIGSEGQWKRQERKNMNKKNSNGKLE